MSRRQAATTADASVEAGGSRRAVAVAWSPFAAGALVLLPVVGLLWRG